jgi:hypothetical protein
MPHFIITYDLRKQRNYKPLYDALGQWRAVRLLESVWLAQLKGPAFAVRDILRSKVDSDDGLAVIELVDGFDWATLRTTPLGANWLKSRSP